MLLVAQQDSFGVKAQVAKSDGLSYIPRTQKVGEKEPFHFHQLSMQLSPPPQPPPHPLHTHENVINVMCNSVIQVPLGSISH